MDVEKEDFFQNLSSSDLASLINSIEASVAFADKSGKICWFSDKFREQFPKVQPYSSIELIFDFPEEFKTFEIPGTIETDHYNISVSKLNDNYSLITVRNRDNKTLIQSDRIKLFKNSAHDLNNILTSIVNSASLLMLEENKDNKTRKLIETLESNSLRAVDIVDSILTNERGTSQTKRKVKITTLMKELQNSLKSITPANVSITFEVSDDVELIMGNYSELYRVFLNLCINSSEAIEGQGSVVVKAENITSAMIPNLKSRTYSKYVKISVKDNGSGIKEKNIKKVFDSDFSTKNKNYNSGLGLSIVKEIISNHDGIINIESEWGIGTTITTYLPARVESAPQKQLNRSSRRILIADDEKSILELLIDLFQSYGFVVLKAKDGKDLMETVKNNSDIDLYIIDRKMPAPDGLECIELMRGMGIKQPIILTTGSLSVADNPALQNLDITQILVKPYDFEELLKLVDELLN